LHTRTCT